MIRNAVMEQFRSVIKVHFRASHDVYREYLVRIFLITWDYAVKGLIIFSFHTV